MMRVTQGSNGIWILLPTLVGRRLFPWQLFVEIAGQKRFVCGFPGQAKAVCKGEHFLPQRVGRGLYGLPVQRHIRGYAGRTFRERGERRKRRIHGRRA